MTERLDRPGVDLVLKLSEDNAARRWSYCEADARYYVFTEGVHATYCCEDHLSDAVEQAQA